MKISEILCVKPGVTALIGGGGKTALMYKLARELSERGTVIVGTSTRILPPDKLPVITGGRDEIAAALEENRVICAASPAAGGKLCAPAVSFCELASLADHVIVEADGAHRLPIKAHAPYEPVIPEGTALTVAVIGADCFDRPIGEICHRPELFAALSGADLSSPVTPMLVKRVIDSEGAGDCLFINKVEDERARENARALAALLDMPVAAGSLIREEYVCLR